LNPERSTWLWISQNDVNSGVVQLDNRNYSVSQQTSTSVTLSYSDATGNATTYTYLKSNWMLHSGQDHGTGWGHVRDSTVEFVGGGLGGPGRPGGPRKLNVPHPGTLASLQPSTASANGPAPPSPLQTISFYPPYYSAYGWRYAIAQDCASAAAAYNAVASNALHYNLAQTVAGICWPWPPYGTARARADAYVLGPSSNRFYVSTPGQYRLDFAYRINGAASTSRTLCVPIGCMVAVATSTFTGRFIRESDNAVITQAATVIWPGYSFFPGSGGFKVWNYAQQVTSTATVSIGSGWYRFVTDFFSDNLSANVAVGLATTNTQITTYDSYVNFVHVS